MAINPKKLKAFVDSGEQPFKPSFKKGKGITQAVLDQAEEDVRRGRLDPEIARLMREAYDPENNPPEWVSNEDLWEKAKEAVDPEGDGAAKYDDPYAVVAAVYKRMGGTVKSK